MEILKHVMSIKIQNDNQNSVREPKEKLKILAVAFKFSKMTRNVVVEDEWWYETLNYLSLYFLYSRLFFHKKGQGLF